MQSTAEIDLLHGHGLDYRTVGMPWFGRPDGGVPRWRGCDTLASHRRKTAGPLPGVSKAARRAEALCRSRWARMRTEAGDEELLLAMACGRRSCPTCGAVARLRAADRVTVGPGATGSVRGTGTPAEDIQWTVMLTLTLDRKDRRPADAARSMGKWVGKFLEQVLNYWNRYRGRPRKYRGNETQYACVLEEHPKNPKWIHAHVALSVDEPRMPRQDFVHFARFLRVAWAYRIGLIKRPVLIPKRLRKSFWDLYTHRDTGLARVQWQPSWYPGSSQTGNYLKPYLSKGVYSSWILDVMYRKRLVISTLKRAEKQASGWKVAELGMDSPVPTMQFLEEIGWEKAEESDNCVRYVARKTPEKTWDHLGGWAASDCRDWDDDVLAHVPMASVRGGAEKRLGRWVPRVLDVEVHARVARMECPGARVVLALQVEARRRRLARPVSELRWNPPFGEISGKSGHLYGPLPRDLVEFGRFPVRGPPVT